MKNPAWDNLESRSEIRKVAFLLFRKLGYKTTSYSMIAEESGQGRPLVQYYYPKKEEIALEFLLEAMETLQTLLKESRKEPSDWTLSTLHFGQLYYTFLLYDEDMRRFTAEVLENRSVTSQLVLLNAKRSLPDGLSEEQAASSTEASIRATGGIYELLFLQLQNKQLLKPGEYAVKNIAAFAASTGTEHYDTTAARLQQNLLTDAEVESYMKNLFEVLF